MACNLASLALTVIATAGLSRLLGGDEITANGTVVISLLAPTFLGRGGDGLRTALPVRDRPGIGRCILVLARDSFI